MNKRLLTLAFVGLLLVSMIEENSSFLAGAGKWGAGKRSIKMEIAKRSFCKRVVDYCGDMTNHFSERRKRNRLAGMAVVGDEFSDYSREENFERKFRNNKIISDAEK